ncbi:dihydrolipoamide acetyltransferase family protein [uncultured Acetobacterium sp.]|uniref:dihydrolipoamide acetyltransferase family protein n=1 Tax=uncultured Acetobacterium sp. TaxID=217139 RepID=UPI00242088E3|nr:dihydrolipoamide acetyltransferase family protein [uncultured Acetobacterium sp.]MBU4541552.1 2-oxo acid dehydrogenase subunit E2 [Bacillota bacterium]MDP2842411.1 dihydrolipoamide acetyltransferase family protein [Acetobacterium sp.]
MAKFLVMPKLGLTMTEGNIANWRKKEGDSVAMGEIIFDVETDKITKEFESPGEGVIKKILVTEGTVEVLKPIAIIGKADEDISALLAEAEKAGDSPAAEVKPASEPDQVAAASSSRGDYQSPAPAVGGRVKASARTKKIAADLNIDISQVTGTGPQGAITEKDVAEFAEKAKTVQPKISPTAGVVAAGLGVDPGQINKDGRIMKADVLAFKQNADFLKYADPQEFTKPMSAMRKIIASRMSASQETSATVNYNQRVDTTAMKQLREELKGTAKITYTDILVKILSRALLEFPLLNSSIVGTDIVTRNYVNMGVAVALPDGLIVPVVKFVNKLDLGQISAEIKALAEKARNNELETDQISGGTFTLTNIGMFGMESFTPIINQPEVAILGVNTIIDTPMVVDGQVVIKPMMNLSLTADHRVVDGSVAAAFVARLKELIEKPGLLLL